MKIQCLTYDIINTLPQNIVDNILTLMPIRDALRTSILSKKWRYRWKSMPKLAFDDYLVGVPCDSIKLEIYELVNAIFHVLLLHKGPLVEFEFSARGLPIGSEFDPIILYLSRINNVKILIFVFLTEYKLPPSFFSLNGLEVLQLENCDFNPPLTFNGFGKLRRVFFWNVEIKAKVLLHFLTNCPLLEEVILNGCFQENFESEGGNEFTFVELLRCVPLVTTLNISKYYMKYFAAGGVPQMLQTPLIHLQSLFLGVRFTNQDELSSTLCLIRNSPNLAIICLKMYGRKLPVQQSSMDFHNLSSFDLDRLKELQILKFCNLPPDMEFVKLIMAKSRVLKKVRLELSAKVSADDEMMMLRDLVRVPFPRASPTAMLIIERPKSSL